MPPFYSRRCLVPIKAKYIFLTTFLILVSIFMFKSINNPQTNLNSTGHNQALLKLPYVAVHIDLKGAPPKLSYLKQLLPMFWDLGANALVMEYEDMFPFSGGLSHLRARSSYTESELLDFLKAAVGMGFEIIPLVQTFGHLEYVLKLESMRHLRENSQFPDSICPSNSESRAFIPSVLKQMIELHNKVTHLKHIHIGCDEVYHINQCEKCRRRNLSNIDLYLDHVEFVSDAVKSMSPNTNVMIWHDMLRTKKPVSKQKTFAKTDVVYWKYNNQEPDHLDLFNLHRQFKNIWIATAYKGADGKNSLIPDIYKRFQNHLTMLGSMRDYKFAGENKVYKFEGIILTGWSRYSHIEPLCDVLQASLSSLIINLMLIKHFKEGKDLQKIKDVNDFVRDYNRDINNKFHCEDVEPLDISKCDFDGTKLFEALKLLLEIKHEIQKHYSDVETGIHAIESALNIKSLNKVQDNIDWCSKMLLDLEQSKKIITHEMNLYYSYEVINELINLHTKDETKLLNKSLETLYKLSTRNIES